jgi:deazaflavin-dependent oxidoreductase (nitroreductase family)
MTDGDDFNQQMIERFRSNGGRLEMGPAALLLLTTTGKKTGTARITPLAAFEDDGQLYVIASYAGAPANPAWFRNLLANPHVTVEYAGETFAAVARVAPDAERARLFGDAAAAVPQFAEYQTKTTRAIPVVTLERVNT